jgi:hypothetical protein
MGDLRDKRETKKDVTVFVTGYGVSLHFLASLIRSYVL